MEAKQALERAFQQWGMPLRIRLDNGPPFANTGDRLVPTALAIWLVSLGIELIFNRPYSPQQNGSVECTQRISHNWANPRQCHSPAQLQQALDLVAKEHTQVYRIRLKGDLTRAQLYPELFTNPRKYLPTQIDPAKAKNYLLQFRWNRKAYGNGRIGIFNQFVLVGLKYSNQQVLISIDPISFEWIIALPNGKVIRTMPPLDLSHDRIADLTVFSMNFTT